jgi:5-methylcytosine-specific restriction endonuclease McrA
MESMGTAGYNRATMGDWIDLDVDPAHVAREREKARALRKTAWWQRRISRGLCAYCNGHFAARDLTMDHVVPVARGGRSTKGNVVPACKSCNNKKKLLTPAEQLMMKPATPIDDED